MAIEATINEEEKPIVPEYISVSKRIVIISNKLRLNKGGKNTFSNYDYFKPDDILKALNPLLEEYNLIIKFDLIMEESKYIGYLRVSDTNGNNDHIDYRFDTGKAVVKGANECQNAGATMTYVKRYMLMNAFNIGINDDDFDSNKMHKRQNVKPSELDITKNEISTSIETLKTAGIKGTEIAEIITSVKDDAGNPMPANYKLINRLADAKKVLTILKQKEIK